ncbi:TonB-dependent receptor domain-containing protein [Neolewinella persica]|uniref:TonB-dependent receptor domain-containing protein n=1 Tax=Neolewinella persica TaxID=70998 RepID=UPI00036CADB2|nr:TonB-dependent receptor [Neolewinella persica]
MKLPYLLTLLFITVLCTCGFAQNTITGRVVDKGSGQPIEFATVLVSDATTKAGIGGTTTDLAGNFTLKTATTEVYLDISFIGFETRRQEAISFSAGQADLGLIELAATGQTLEEVTVRAEKSQTEFKLDKRVFNVGKDLSSTGAGALEVLNNVPSVNVTIEGQVQLRGSGGVQILINGKPSVIASEQGNLLGTITADMIESVEVITNPSAKYDAEGTAGIINIVLKKEERKGLNGAISVNTGTPENHSVGLSLNRRTDKFNLFSQLGVGYREQPNEERAINQDRVSGNTVSSEGTEFRNEFYYNAVLGTDYLINERNVITLSGNFSYEIEDQPSRNDFTLTDAANEILSTWKREEETEATNPKYQFELQYKRDFEDHKDHDLIFSALGTLFSKDQSSEFANTTLSGLDRDGRQQTRTNFGQQENTFKVDYTRPVNEKMTVETGAQYVTSNVNNDFSVSNFDGTNFVVDPDLTNIFNWNQKVLAFYGTGAYQFANLGIKFGLRLENTDLETLLETTNESNDQNYSNLFPSAASSYKISDAVSVQASYSRRIFRPRLWDLNPFFNPRNNFNIRAGNPNLQPEFTDSYEVTSIFILGETSFNVGAYRRYTTDVVERITIFQDNVSITTPRNIGINRTTGLELNFKTIPAKFMTITGDLNYNFFSREGELEGTSFDFSADQYSGKMTTKFNLPLDFDFEVTGQYQSAFQTVQSEVSEQLFADLGLRKKLFGGKGAVSFSVRDLFASRIQESVIDQVEVYQYSRRLRGRFITLGFSYGFGKGETMEYSGQRRRG